MWISDQKIKGLVRGLHNSQTLAGVMLQKPEIEEEDDRCRFRKPFRLKRKRGGVGDRQSRKSRRHSAQRLLFLFTNYRFSANSPMLPIPCIIIHNLRDGSCSDQQIQSNDPPSLLHQSMLNTPQTHYKPGACSSLGVISSTGPV